MWMLLVRYTYHTCTSGPTLTQTSWAWYRYASSHSVNSHQSMPSLSNLRTCPILSTHPSTHRLGTHHNQVTHHRPQDTEHSQATHHKEGGTLLTLRQGIHKLEVIHPPIQVIPQEVEATHLILQQLSQQLPDQEQLLASVQNTSRQVSSLPWRTR